MQHVDGSNRLGRIGIWATDADAERAALTDHDMALRAALNAVIDEQSATVRRFLVVPIGFVCDHTEILFDIDVLGARIAREFATSLRRTESLNTSPLFVDLLEQLVRARL